MGNGATASDLFEFLRDNPGACEAVLTWICDEGCTQDGVKVDDADAEEEICDECEMEALDEMGLCPHCDAEPVNHALGASRD